jgi:hypothetical protein
MMTAESGSATTPALRTTIPGECIMANYTIDLQMSSETVHGLKVAGYSLFAFKAVRTAAAAKPTVWFSTNTYETDSKLSWQENYEGYNSSTAVVPGGTIKVANSEPFDIDETMTIAADGTISVVSGGLGHAMAVVNLADSPYTTGISQEDPNGHYAPLCAFSLNGGGMTVTFTPVEKVLLMFATSTIDTGAVIEQAFSQGALIDLTGVSSRSVSYALNTGWVKQPFVQIVPALSKIDPLLIVQDRLAQAA